MSARLCRAAGRLLALPVCPVGAVRSCRKIMAVRFALAMISRCLLICAVAHVVESGPFPVPAVGVDGPVGDGVSVRFGGQRCVGSVEQRLYVGAYGVDLVEDVLQNGDL